MNDNALNIHGGINAEELRKDDYLASLLEQSHSAGLVSGDEVDRIKIKCIKLLAELAEHYTSGESSSIPQAVADMLLKNILYTTGVSLKSYPSPNAALSALLEKGIEPIYTDGRVRIRQLLNDAKKSYSSLLASLVPIDNRTYNETIRLGIKGFFKKYDPVFAAHKTVITADYPVSADLSGLTGIEFIYSYIAALDAENTFLSRFNPSDIILLLSSIDSDYGELVTGIYMIVFIQALGCAVVGRNPYSLILKADDIAALREKLGGISADEVERIITSAYNGYFINSGNDNGHSNTYIQEALKTAADEIYYALCGSVPKRVFTEMKHNVQSSQLVFDMGLSMDDDKYRALLAKIASCRNWTDKISLITREAKSLVDYSNLLLDAKLSREDSYHLLNVLKHEDIAALCVAHGLFDKLRYGYGDNSDKAAVRLSEYVNTLSSEDVGRIIEMYKNIKLI